MGLYIVNPQSPRALLDRKFISQKLDICLALSAAVGLNNALCLSKSCGMPHLILSACLEIWPSTSPIKIYFSPFQTLPHLSCLIKIYLSSSYESKGNMGNNKNSLVLRPRTVKNSRITLPMPCIFHKMETECKKGKG